MDRIYVDTEYIFPSMSRESGRPTSDDVREIVQIAATRVNPITGVELAAFDQLVAPTFVRPIPPFFSQLTEITIEEIEKRGVKYSDALSQFVDFSHNADTWTYNADWDVFRHNCQLHEIPFPFEHQPFKRVFTMLAGWGVKNSASYSSGTLHKAAGIAMDGHVHNALFDVRSMSQAVHVFEYTPNGPK